MTLEKRHRACGRCTR